MGTCLNRVTAARRRPQKFDELVGQDFVVATLKASIEKQKIAHAYLFSGPRGCGKTSSARILAKALNCQKGMNATPCGECDSCKAITEGSSFDVIEIDGASNTSVNDVRQIKDEVLFPPSASRYKIYIIDEVHMLSTSAFNALLKTIEEPPPYIVFIFATTELHKVPATIKSRCQQFNFRLVSVEQLKDTLRQTVEEIGIEAEDEALYWVAKEATGSVRDAYTLFDQVEAFSDGKITMQKIQEKLGLASLDSMNTIFSYCVKGNASGAVSCLDEILQQGVSIEQFIVDSATFLRAVLLLKEGIEKEAILGFNKERLAKNVVEEWNQNQVEIALAIMLALYKDVRFSLSPRFETELALSRIASLKDYVAPEDLKKAFDAARNLLESEADSVQGGRVGTSNFDKVYSEKKNYRAIDEASSLQKKNDDIDNLSSEDDVFNGGSTSISMRNFDKEQGTSASSTPQKADSEKVDNVQDLRRLIISASESENGMLHLTLGGTGDWEERNETLFIYGKTSFDVSMLKNNLQAISKYVQKYYARHLKVDILKEEKRGNLNPEKKTEALCEKQIDAKVAEDVASLSGSAFQASEAQAKEAKYVEDMPVAKKVIPDEVRLVMEMFAGELVRGG